MKQVFTLAIAIAVMATSFAAGTTIVLPKKSPSPNANQILLPVGKNGEKISLMDLSVMKTKDYEALTGRKMNLANKLEFKIIQRKLRDNIDANGNINSKMLAKATTKAKKAASEKTHKYLMLWLIFLGAAIVLGIIGWAVPFFWILSSLAGLGALIFFILWLLSMSGTM
jgi:hypothetical protein